MAQNDVYYTTTDWPTYVERPNQPAYRSPYNSSMNMTPQLNDRLNSINMGGLNSAMDANRTEALRTGPSNYSKLAMGQQQMMANQARDQGAKDISSGNATAANNLAMRGGLSAGASERIARQGGRDYLNMSQGIAGQSMNNNQQIMMNDEQNRIRQVGALPGQEIAAMQPEFQKTQLWGQGKQFDVNKAYDATKNYNDYNMDAYKMNMAAWAANQQAAAEANS